MEPLLTDYITLPRKEFCRRVGLSETTVIRMIKDGRLKTVQLSERKQMILVQSYLDLLAKQAEKDGRGVDLKALGLL